jgi:uncharacterized membrane protein YraQ (UPF0718 family)
MLNIIMYAAPIALGAYALTRPDKSFQKGLFRGVEQFIIILPRMICALIGAEFMAMLIPTEVISGLLGSDAGIIAILIGSVIGMLVPSGPVISFSIAATLLEAGASVPAIMSFLTAWSLFSAHRIFIYEIPLLGMSFLRLRLASVLILPVLSGILALAAIELISWVVP